MGEGIFESHIALARFAGEGKGEGSVLTPRWIQRMELKKLPGVSQGFFAMRSCSEGGSRTESAGPA
jgi:hypothetical protein